MARTSVPLALCLALLLPAACLGLIFSSQQSHSAQARRFRGHSQCHIQKLNAAEPTSRLQSEAGLSEYWDESEQQFQCAGVATSRHTIEPSGLFLPSYTNSPKLVYVAQGTGYGSILVPGCPESFQSFQQYGGRGSSTGSSSSSDQHQRIERMHQGDMIAIPAGLTGWVYNDGDSPLVLIILLDISNYANQLDSNPRRFFLAGSESSQMSGRSSSYSKQHGGESAASSILSGFDSKILSQALGISQDVVKKLQNVDASRGIIFYVHGGLQVVQPTWEERKQWESTGRGSSRSNERSGSNGIEESLCNVNFKENIGDPMKADVYSREGGHITHLNSHKLPILRWVHLSADKGHLHRNAMVAPNWDISAHTIIYIINGSARIQVIGSSGKSLFNDRVNEGQMIVVPQNFVVVKKAEDNEVHWISFKTSDNSMVSPLAGLSSVFRGIPADVLANSYQTSSEEASMIKHGREETMILSPQGSSSYTKERRASQ